MTRLRSEYLQERAGWRQTRALLPHRGPHGPRLCGLRDRETSAAQPIRNGQKVKYVFPQVSNYSINYFNGGKYPLPQTLLVRYLFKESLFNNICFTNFRHES